MRRLVSCKTQPLMADELDVLLSRVDDPALRSALQRQVALLRDRRSFGLVFENHLPETARLPHHGVRRGVTVAMRDEVDGEHAVVLAVAGDKATIADRDGETREVDVDDLVAVARFGDPIYPGLAPVGSVRRGGDKPAHVVINGENHHVLEALRFSHTGGIDCIYIDPPYNLGGDLTYNDKRIAKDDANRHSLWLSFMDRRLRLAKELLVDTGIIIVAIDDTEGAHLRLLLDQVFTEAGYIATIVWQGGRKNDARFVSVGHDYMLIYARSPAALNDAGIRWRELKAGVHEALDAAESIWVGHEGDTQAATAEWRRWLRAQRAAGVTTDAVNRYDMLESGTGRPINTYGNLTWPGGGGPRYEVLHPVSGKPVTIPIPGWRFQDPAKMQELIDAGSIYFGADETTIPRGISYLDELGTQVAISVFEQDRKAVNARLREILGEDRFQYPKDTRVLARWIDLVTTSKPGAVVLDFFGGSGSTCQAVMELNAADGGRRQCILVTNNEVDAKRARQLTRDRYRDGDPEWERWGIFHHVARPRLETVVTGVRADGSTYSDGLEENLELFELTYQDAGRVELDLAFAAVAPLLWLRAGGRGPVIAERTDTHGHSTPYSCTDHYGVLFDLDHWRRFVEHLPDGAKVAFVVTDSSTTFSSVAKELPAGVEAVRLYENYLSTFEINRGG